MQGGIPSEARKMQIVKESMLVMKAIARRADEVRGCNASKAKSFDDLSMGVAMSALKQTSTRKVVAA
jgi:hypothetical protein